MRLSSLARTVSIAVALVAIVPATWWLGTLLPDSVGPDSDPDHMLEPPVLADGVAVGLGVGSLVLVAVGVAVLAQAVRSGSIRREWVGVLAPIAACAAYAGVAYSVMTAPVIGANIGGGLAALAAVPFGVAMVTVSVVLGRRLALGRHRHGPARSTHQR